MKILILVSLLLIGCDQSVDVKNNGNDNRLLGSLIMISNSGNSNNVTHITTTSGGGTVTTSANGTTYTVGGVTYTAGTTANTALSSQIARFLLGTFIIDTPNVSIYTSLTYAQNEKACLDVGYRPVTFSEFKLFVELIEFARANSGRVPTAWAKLSDRFYMTDGYTFWITDRDSLFSNDLAYRTRLTKTYSGMYTYGSFYYANERMDSVYNKTNVTGAISLLCYKIN